MNDGHQHDEDDIGPIAVAGLVAIELGFNAVEWVGRKLGLVAPAFDDVAAMRAAAVAVAELCAANRNTWSSEASLALSRAVDVYVAAKRRAGR